MTDKTDMLMPSNKEGLSFVKVSCYCCVIFSFYVLIMALKSS